MWLDEGVFTMDKKLVIAALVLIVGAIVSTYVLKPVVTQVVDEIW